MSIKNNSLPTMRQIGYLTELEKYNGKDVSISQIARSCNTDHGAVSRFFKSCSEKGILTQEYRLTEYGENWLHSYQRLGDELNRYFRDAELSDEEMDSVCAAMLENVEPHVLKRIFAGKNPNSAVKNGGNVRSALNQAIRERGDVRVFYCFYRTEGDYTQERLSMANGGFERDAYLRWVNGNAYLELTTCEMTARSRIDGREMKGHLKTLKYHTGGFLREAKQDGGKILLPLNDFRIWQGKIGVTRCTLPVTVTCTVGDEHMPESTASLVFWA